MNKITGNGDGTFVLEMTREFQASRERVFAAFSKYEAMALWFGPHGCHVSNGELEFVVGGHYRLPIHSEENETNTVAGVFQEIVPPSRLVFTWQWEPRVDVSDDEMEVTIDFFELGENRSKIQLRQVRLSSETVADQHGWGWGESFERLEKQFVD